MDAVVPTTDQTPLLMVEEAGRMLRIGRSKAYAMAGVYLRSGGTAGLPVIVLGSSTFRVPRWSLLVLINTGRVVRLCDVEVPAEEPTVEI